MKLKWLVSLDGRAWSASLLNVLAMALQLWTLLSTRDTTGVSIGMLLIFVYVQVTFAQVGWKTKQWALFYGLFLSFLLTATILVITLCSRHFGIG